MTKGYSSYKRSLRKFDPRIFAYDAGRRVAEEALREHAPPNWLFVVSWAAWALRPRVSLRAGPSWDAPQVTEAILGEEVEVLERREDGWQWLRTKHDRYLGWARLEFFGAAPPPEDSLMVHVPRAHAYAGPNITEPILAELTWGAKLPRAVGQRMIMTDGRAWTPILLPNSNALAWMSSACLIPHLASNPAEFAQSCLGVPYMLGGRTALGLDCGGLSQLAYAACGRSIPRDPDLQQQALTPTLVPKAGDLAFFPGHVGIMLDSRRMIHANARNMRVTIQVLGEGENGKRLENICKGYASWKPIEDDAEEDSDSAAQPNSNSTNKSQTHSTAASSQKASSPTKIKPASATSTSTPSDSKSDSGKTATTDKTSKTESTDSNSTDSSKKTSHTTKADSTDSKQTDNSKKASNAAPDSATSATDKAKSKDLPTPAPKDQTKSDDI